MDKPITVNDVVAATYPNSIEAENQMLQRKLAEKDAEIAALKERLDLTRRKVAAHCDNCMGNCAGCDLHEMPIWSYEAK